MMVAVLSMLAPAHLSDPPTPTISSISGSDPTIVTGPMEPIVVSWLPMERATIPLASTMAPPGNHLSIS
ncbi:MAG: hypothetical protein R2784_02220 [Saprospiraceae bacterium]